MKGVDLAKDHFLHLQGEAGVVAQSCELLLFLLLLPKDLTGLGRGLKGAPLQFSRLAEFPVLAYTAILLAVLLKGLGRVIEGGLIPVTGLLLGGVLLPDAAALVLGREGQILADRGLLQAAGVHLHAAEDRIPAADGQFPTREGPVLVTEGLLPAIEDHTPAIEDHTLAGGIQTTDAGVLTQETAAPARGEAKTATGTTEGVLTPGQTGEGQHLLGAIILVTSRTIPLSPPVKTWQSRLLIASVSKWPKSCGSLEIFIRPK